MPRTPRLDVAGVTQYVVQRGNDRQPCFFRESDYLRYLQDLKEGALKFGCQVHAYVLMTNHVHLLLTPGERGATGRMMQSVGRRYVRHINDSLARTGTLWEGRYKSSLIDSECYALACYRYIELNPVRAGMVLEPGDYGWPSYKYNALGEQAGWLSPHPAYTRLSNDDSSRLAAYRDLVQQGLSDDERDALRLYLQRQRALGSSRFQSDIEQQLNRRAGLGQPGRPRKLAGPN